MCLVGAAYLGNTHMIVSSQQYFLRVLKTMKPGANVMRMLWCCCYNIIMLYYYNVIMSLISHYWIGPLVSDRKILWVNNKTSFWIILIWNYTITAQLGLSPPLFPLGIDTAITQSHAISGWQMLNGLSVFGVWAHSFSSYTMIPRCDFEM